MQFFIYHIINEFSVDLFLDVGANYGECAFAVPLYTSTQIVGYEANESLHAYLRRSLAYNDDITKIELVHAAVSRVSGETLAFFVDPGWSGKSSVVRDKESGLKRVEVVSTSIDHEIDRLEKRCDLLLLKMDVEGYEPAVFDGAEKTLRTVPNIICLMEFDEKYLARGGVDPEVFFEKLISLFSVYVLGEKIQKCFTYGELLEAANGKRIHVNLILTRINDDRIASHFQNNFSGISLKEVSRKLW